MHHVKPGQHHAAFASTLINAALRALKDKGFAPGRAPGWVKVWEIAENGKHQRMAIRTTRDWDISVVPSEWVPGGRYLMMWPIIVAAVDDGDAPKERPGVPVQRGTSPPAVRCNLGGQPVSLPGVDPRCRLWTGKCLSADGELSPLREWPAIPDAG